MNFASNLKPHKTTQGFISFFNEKPQSDIGKQTGGKVSNERVQLNVPKTTNLVIDGKKATYLDAPYHHQNSTGTIKSKAPVDGVKSLENSLLLKDTSRRRVGVDKINNEIVIFDCTNEGISSIEYHGHVRSWDIISKDEKIKNFLFKNNLVDTKGRIIK